MILPPPNWMIPPAQPSLLPGEIHLWRADLTDPSRLRESAGVLSVGESIRAERFVFEEDRQHFIISHGALRFVLARYLCTPAGAIEFAPGVNGKPTLVQRFTDIRFNLSHSGGLALIAVARGRDVGVDLEEVDDAIHFEEIASHYFEPDETWDLRTAPPEDRTARFFDVWTRKEAALKATGAGLTGKVPTAGRIAVRNVTPAAGFAGAVASEGDDWRLACWEWSM